MKSNLTFATLMGYLQHHYKEKSSTELCAQLTSIIQMPNEGPVDFILRCIKLREKLILTFKTSGEIEYDEILVSRLFLRNVERGLESNLVQQEIRPVLRSQGVLMKIHFQLLKEPWLMRKTEQGISLKDQVSRVVGNPAASGFDCSDPDKNKCGPESSKLISELTKALSAVTEQLVALRTDVDVLKTQCYNPVSYAPNRCGYKSCIEQNIRQCQHCFKCGASGNRGKDCENKKPDQSGEDLT